MRPRRRSPLLDGLTFGGRMPGAVGLLLVLMVGGTVLGAVTPLAGLAFFNAGDILGGEIWRLVTWVFFQNDPLALIFGGLALWQTGTQLSLEWGEQRFLARFFGLTVGAAVAATLLGLLWPPARGLSHLGMWPVVMALWLAWSLQHAGAQVQLMMVLPVTGQTMALIIVFGTVLYGLFAGRGSPLLGLASFALHFAAQGIAYGYTRGVGLPTRRWRVQLDDWRREREFKRKSKHLKVVKKNGQDDPPKWMN